MAFCICVVFSFNASTCVCKVRLLPGWVEDLCILYDIKKTKSNGRTNDEIWTLLRDRYFSSTKLRACSYVAAFSKSVHSISSSRVTRRSRYKNKFSFNFKINIWTHTEYSKRSASTPNQSDQQENIDEQRKRWKSKCWLFKIFAD